MIGSFGDFVRQIGQAIEILGLRTKPVVMLSVPLTLDVKDRDSPRVAFLELLEVNELASRLEERTCALYCLKTKGELTYEQT